MPPFLEVSTAVGCPVRCVFCPEAKALAAHEARGGPRLMPLETFTTCLAKMPAGTSVSFAGFAEPWLNHQATAMAEYCHAAGVQWEAYTTCVGMSLEDVERIAAAKPIRIKLHLPDVEGYAKIRVDDRYISVVTALAEAIGPACSMMTMGTLPQVLHQKFGKLKAAVMHSRAGNVEPSDRVRLVVHKRGALKCRPGPELDRNILLPDGSLILCCFDFSQRHVIGNLLHQTWEEIREGEPLKQLRAAMASEDGACLCRTCEVSIPASEKVKCV